jgi:alpha-N-arabinofuranosidase
MTGQHRACDFRWIVCLVACTWLACTLPAASVSAQITESTAVAGAEIHLRVMPPTHPQVVPATLFGSFLEPIGHSTYGGLWADVVQNPSFESGLWSAGNLEEMLHDQPELRQASHLGLPLPWEPLDGGQGSRYLPVRGDAGNSDQSLLIMALPQTEVGIRQRVYLPVQRELHYTGSLMVKHVRGETDVRVSLRQHEHSDEILASATVHADSASWTTYPFSLALSKGVVVPLDPVDLVISLRDDARAQIDNVALDPADAVEGMDPDELAMARALESPVVRFGGNFTSAYNWRDGVGPTDKRVSVRNVSWGIPEYNTFGTDEFLQFCRLIGAQPQIALNLGTSTPAQQAAWVRYVNEHWNGGKGGLLWELGNELWGNFQIGYPSQERIAAITLANSQAVRAVDPQARLIATGGDEDFFNGWNAQQLSNPPGTFDFLSTHFVVQDTVQLPGASDEFRDLAALALPWGLGPKMHAIAEQASNAGHPHVRVAFTEWLMVSDSHRGPNFTNLGGALFAGGLLNMVLRNADVVSISNMTGIMEFGGIWKKRAQVYGAPAYWVLRSYAHEHPYWVMDITSDGPTYSVQHGITRLPVIKDVPYLDCAATEPKDHKALILTCVNRNLTRPATAAIDLSALAPVRGPITISTIAGENLLTENDETAPRRIAPVITAEPAEAVKTLRHTFPNASITVLRIGLE